MADQKAEIELSQWQWSFLVDAAASAAEKKRETWDEEVRQGRMRRSEMVVGLMECNTVVERVTEAAARARG